MSKQHNAAGQPPGWPHERFSNFSAAMVTRDGFLTPLLTMRKNRRPRPGAAALLQEQAAAPGIPNSAPYSGAALSRPAEIGGPYPQAHRQKISGMPTCRNTPPSTGAALSTGAAGTSEIYAQANRLMICG
ncbi:hypothetical protein, partial [Streptomyces sp. H39-C1]|uniref:hypothetical protein n=1 Tax=Streptomyces sp. H39-C1 TaxID=3004355 RepID=UPI0022AF258E